MSLIIVSLRLVGFCTFPDCVTVEDSSEIEISRGGGVIHHL